jgi:hypothetical protein
MRRPQEPRAIVRPHPPTANAACKRFSVRDGFHLKERNDEQRVEIDHAIGADGIIQPSAGALPTNQTSDASYRASDEHSHASVVPHGASCVDVEVAMIFDFLQRPAPAFAVTEVTASNTPVALPVEPPKEAPGVVPPLAHRQAEAAAIMSRIGPSADWLIYRHRSNETPRRKEAQLEQRIAEVLNAKEDQILHPIAPTQSKRFHRRSRQPASTIPTDPISRRMNGYTAGAELLPVPSRPARSCSPAAFSTHRSRLREKSAVPLKTEKLLGRLHELRSFPVVVERVLQLHHDKRQEQFATHGENLIAKNKTLHRLVAPLQRPVHTPVFPSIVDRRQHQASQRKKLVDETQVLTLKRAVNRWQNRRAELQHHERTHYVQSQWLLITHLGEATAKWSRLFHECRARRDLIFRLAMIKRIQRYWKQQQFLRQHKQQVLAMPANSPLRSQFYRMPRVLHAILVVQTGMRSWLARMRRQQNRRAIEIIITSWLEFQDVKFRRLILRFRKRVREFQTRWRTWRAITDARIKLLLLVWAKVERKHKRRNGVATSGGDNDDPHAAARHQPRSTTSEAIHRHLRNGGMVLTAVSALGSSIITETKKTTSPRKSPGSKRAKPELALRQHVEDDLEVAMRDFYATSSLSPHHHQSTTMPRGSQAVTTTTSSQPWKPIAHVTDEKIPHSLKASLLRQLLSEKRKAFRATKDRRRSSLSLHLLHADRITDRSICV